MRSRLRRRPRPRVDAVLALAFVIDTAIAVIDAFTAAVLINLVVVGPLLAATRVGPRRTAAISVYAVALAVYEGVPHDILGSADHVIRCTAIALTGGLAVWTAHLRQREERARRHAALLADVGARLNAMLEDAAIARVVADVVVPSLADRCAVLTTDRHGSIRSVAAASRTSDPETLTEAVRQAWASAARPATAPSRRLAPASTDAVRDVLAGADAGKVLVAPITGRRRTVGLIALVGVGRRAAFDEVDRRVIDDLAGRCAVALDTAEEYRQRSRVATQLQDRLLPTQLPHIPGFEIAARFHAGDDIEVGGDFLDVFDTDDGWAAVIGDVSGKGAAAAAVTAIARYTIRAVADREPEPSAVMLALNDALLRQDLDDRFCTAAFAAVRTSATGATVRICSAGHPPPFVVRGDGSVAAVDARGMALGITGRPQLTDAQIELGPGDKLVLYTDGVIEARLAAGMLGLDGLARVLASSAADDAVRTGERVYRAAAVAAADNDDIAVLVIRGATDDVPRGNEGLARTGASGRRGVLQMRLSSGPEAPWAARRAIDALEIPVLAPADAHRARLLVSEIVSEAVRRASADAGGWIGFDADLTPDRLSVEVRHDGAQLSTDPVEPASEDETARHGRKLIDRLADRWGLRDGGRCVWFEIDRHARPRAPDAVRAS